MDPTRIQTDYARASSDSATVAHRLEGAFSWGAVLAGGAGAAAFALILLTVGTGLGLTSLSPWSSGTANAKVFGVAAVIWVCVTSILTSGLGGYLAGRLRHCWLDLDPDEIHFRDTAHGFLSWSVATLFTAAVLTSAVSGIARTGAQAVAAATSASGAATMTMMQRGSAATALDTWPLGYFVDSLFRLPAGAPAASSAVSSASNDIPRAETARILLNSAASGAPLSTEDTAYLAQLIAQRTGLPSDAAQARVTTIYTRLLQKINALDDAAKNAAEQARRVTIGASLWLFVSLLMGAFSASLMATYGGRARQL